MSSFKSRPNFKVRKMTQVKSQNQVHPHKKGPTQDKEGNSRYRLFFKSGNSTMLFAQGLTRSSIKVLTSQIDNTISKLGSKIEGQWIITK